jgi:hypothetical protein
MKLKGLKYTIDKHRSVSIFPFKADTIIRFRTGKRIKGIRLSSSACAALIVGLTRRYL